MKSPLFTAGFFIVYVCVFSLVWGVHVVYMYCYGARLATHVFPGSEDVRCMLYNSCTFIRQF